MGENQIWQRRQFLLAAGIVGSTGLSSTGTTSNRRNVNPMFRYCLNTSTIRGQELTIDQEIDIAAKAGYDGIEPWLRDINDYVAKGGQLKDLQKRIADHGLTVESAIGFAKWMVDDNQERSKGLEEAKRDMETIAQLGGTRIAAPPAGATTGTLDLQNSAARYKTLLKLGDRMGVVPQIEVWGPVRTLHKLSQAIYIALEAGHPKACVLGDVYHFYKGGSDFDGIRMLGPQALQVFHFNDYPADPPRDTIKDEHRVYPGDGVAPLSDILNNFRAVGAAPALSLELFNRSYWQQDALEVAKIGLEKMKTAVAKSQQK